MMKRYAILAFCLLPSLAFGQAAPTQQTPTRLDAATNVCAQTPLVNVQTTCTITPPNGQYVYITAITLAACGDAAGTLATSANANWTSTNLGGFAAQTSVTNPATNTTAAACDRLNLVFATPLKSAASGVAVTIVSPTNLAHIAFPQTVQYYFAP